MSIEVVWEISQMQNRIADEGVFYVEWYCYAIKDSYQKSVKGEVNFNPDPSSENFTPLNNLTENQVLGWVWNQIDKSAIEENVKAMLNEAMNPTVDYTLPWLSAE